MGAVRGAGRSAAVRVVAADDVHLVGVVLVAAAAAGTVHVAVVMAVVMGVIVGVLLVPVLVMVPVIVAVTVVVRVLVTVVVMIVVVIVVEVGVEMGMGMRRWRVDSRGEVAVDCAYVYEFGSEWKCSGILRVRSTSNKCSMLEENDYPQRGH